MATLHYENSNPKNAVLSLKAAILADAVIKEIEASTMLMEGLNQESKDEIRENLELEIKLTLSQMGGA